MLTLIGYRDRLPVFTGFRRHHENHRKLVMVGDAYREESVRVDPPEPTWIQGSESKARKGFGWLEFSRKRKVDGKEVKDGTGSIAVAEPGLVASPVMGDGASPVLGDGYKKT